MAQGNLVNFVYITLEKFNTLSEKLADTLYFVKETQKLYKGDKLYTSEVKACTLTEAQAENNPNTIYLIVDESGKYTGQIIGFINGSMDNIFFPYVTNIMEENIENENHRVPTSKAVKDAVTKVKDDLQAKIDSLPKDLVVTAGKYDSSIECILLTINTEKSYPLIEPAPTIKDNTNNYGYTDEVIIIPASDVFEEFNFEKGDSDNVFVDITRNVNGQSLVKIDFKINGVDKIGNLVVVSGDSSIEASNISINSTDTLGNSTTVIPTEATVNKAIENTKIVWEVIE